MISNRIRLQTLRLAISGVAEDEEISYSFVLVNLEGPLRVWGAMDVLAIISFGKGSSPRICLVVLFLSAEPAARSA